jgi:hypothetical protein
MANKKINQLVAKTTILSTDLFPLGNPTTGQLFKKTIGELQAAIGGAVISVNGLVGTVVLDTDDIAELASPTNRYFTEARARASISLTTTGTSGASTYSNSTGVLNVPNYTLAGLGGITASFLSAGAGISYNSGTGVISYTGNIYTDASIRALFSAGTGISYNSSTGAISYSGTVYTDASIRALISLTTTGSSGASTYNNTTGVLNVPTYTLAGLGGISLTSLSGTAPISYNSSTGVISISQANTTTNGFLSSTDWNTFNGKQSALTLGNVTESVSNVLMFPDGGTNKTIGNLSIQVVQAGSTTNGYLSTTDWNTFNNKQNAITLTTTGTTGASTFSSSTLNIPQYQGQITLTTTGTSGTATFTSNTLNIPQYQAALTNPVTGTGSTGYHAKWTSLSAIGNSNLYDSGSNVGLGTTSPAGAAGTTLEINGVAGQGRLAIKNNATGSTSTDGLQIGVDTGGAAFIENRGANSLQLNTNGSARLFITSAGNVGIGTSSPNNYALAVEYNAGSTAVMTLRNSSTTGFSAMHFLNNTGSLMGHIGYANTSTGAPLTDAIFFGSIASKAVIFTSNDTERMRITSGGDIGIGTATPGYKVEIAGTGANSQHLSLKSSASAANAYLIQSSSTKSYITGLSTDFSNGYIFYDLTATTLRMMITSGGNILMGTSTDNGERLYVSGAIRATGTITANSDARLKKNIERIENALEKVGQISGYTYNTIYDEDRHAGVIAQEIDKVLPEIVNTGNDGLMGVEYGNISALLIEAIKEQKVLIESLQAKVEALSK